MLTSLQAQRLRALVAQGSSFAAADTQSRNEVLRAFGIDPTRVNSLTGLYSMRIDGNGDADAVLTAVSAILSKMASNAAVANGTSQPSELSNFISTIAAQLASSGSISTPSIIQARDAAKIQIDLAAVRANIQTYYENRWRCSLICCAEIRGVGCR